MFKGLLVVLEHVPPVHLPGATKQDQAQATEDPPGQDHTKRLEHPTHVRVGVFIVAPSFAANEVRGPKWDLSGDVVFQNSK